MGSVHNAISPSLAAFFCAANIWKISSYLVDLQHAVALVVDLLEDGAERRGKSEIFMAKTSLGAICVVGEGYSRQVAGGRATPRSADRACHLSHPKGHYMGDF